MLFPKVQHVLHNKIVKWFTAAAVGGVQIREILRRLGDFRGHEQKLISKIVIGIRVKRKYIIRKNPVFQDILRQTDRQTNRHGSRQQ